MKSDVQAIRDTLQTLRSEISAIDQAITEMWVVLRTLEAALDRLAQEP
ncbi:hypothetical protein [Sulfobacillus thermosulfidooxidans]|nr:hypothetical protein [Sulfobacillus thermosulfidooxidans]